MSSVSNNSSFVSTYIKDRIPERYTASEESYKARTARVVQETAQKISDAVKGQESLLDLFHDLLSGLSNERRELAVENKQEDLASFGASRTSSADFKGPVCFTVLTKPYDEYGGRLLEDIQRLVFPMKYDLNQFHQTERKLQDKGAFGRNFSLEVEIFPGEKMNEWGTYSWENYPTRLYELCEVAKSDLSFDELVYIESTMARLKKNSPDDYKKIKLFSVLSHVSNNFIKLASDWIVVTPRLEIGGKMVALSQYVTYAYRNFSDDPVKHMKDRSAIVTIIHHDVFLMDQTLVDIAKVFKQTIEWDKKDVKDLRNAMALLEYEFAHAAPFRRGTPTISEWLVMGIYAYHGFTSHYDSKKMVNLEALISTPEDFAKNYASMIELKEIKKEAEKTD